MSENPQPNWYPDPSGEAELRWWDGAQWTEYTHSNPVQHPHTSSDAFTETAADNQAQVLTPDAPRRRKKTGLVIVASVAALALVVTGSVLLPRFLSQDSAVQAEPVIVNGVKYLPPIELALNERSPAVKLNASVDLSELRDRLMAEGEPNTYDTGVIGLYADRELTMPVHAFTSTNDGPDGLIWEISPLQAIDEAWNDVADRDFETLDGLDLDNLTSADLEGLDLATLGLDMVIYDKELPWSQYSEYWLKRTHDGDGNKLEFPEVTQIIPKFETERPDPVRVTFAKGAEDGSVKISWTAPEYADKNTEYYLVRSGPSPFADSADEEWSTYLVGALKGVTSYDTTDYRANTFMQNAGLRLYTGDSADSQEYGPDTLWRSTLNTSNARIGVIAKHDGKYSPLELVAPDASVRAQPSEIAFFQVYQTRDATQQWDVGDLSGLETWLPVITLDGATRSMQVQIDPSSLNPNVMLDVERDENGNAYMPEGVSMKGTILGTVLTESYASKVPAGMTKAEWMAQLPTHIEAFNARSLADQAKTGAVLLTVEDADHTIDFGEYRQLKASSSTPKIDFPVFGTHPMVEHIAANMIAGEPSIDVSKWADQPGAPSPRDAYREAVTQNPLINYGRPVVDFDGNKVYIDYVFDQDKREEAMQISYDAAKAVAATVEGKSDTEKVVAINQWVIDNTEYDYDSLAVSQGGGLSTVAPLGHIAYDSEFTAWSPLGVFRDGKAVCSGYAQAFTLIAREAGLESVVVVGETTRGGPHAWNRVNVDGTWKSLDPTWNDSKSEQNRYLLINEDEYTGNAERTTDSTDSWILQNNQYKFDTP